MIARYVYSQMCNDLSAGMAEAKNAKRLSALHELALDVDCCLEIDQFDFTAVLGEEGYLSRCK
jgi:hypothetical protein